MTETHLLSIKDLDLSDQLPVLIEAGVTSFKIEGRLKDIVYVKNNVSYLRKRLDAFLEVSDKFQKASSGRTFYSFDPQMDKSFNRGYTDYFVNKRDKKIGSWETPKSQGEFIGKILELTLFKMLAHPKSLIFLVVLWIFCWITLIVNNML